ncbi:UTP--GlnB (protein PII) uridylyltransferase GlnD [Roseimicrobium gellanilyticum]|uniref:Bifunctional uridylyltransferase/uridylyl-removing enzyme n=1 Tax=Roseimicrobium gellanilyticum TaxID=748857 RepID=A0A366HPN5_9BACT|nr:[protein-PII] uridylyltransferase [Roseimicrobium gellanilyticum]RBP45455.1 UTP--GlnB (protein PII) uridylyltransferase GlnD [Roseimicrobium gellanilyticum]
MAQLVKKLSTRAREALANTTGKPRSPAEILRTFKRFRKIEEARIRMMHKAGGGGVEICEMRSDFIDVLLKHLWNELLLREDAAEARSLKISLVATGGYGRRHMNPQSDVDLLFLLSGNGTKVPTALGPFITAFITTMFDLRLAVGDKSTRTVGDTLSLANEKNDVKTALIEARLVAGNEEPYQELKRRYDKECMDGKETQFLLLRQQDLLARHAKYEGTPSVQEPNVKNGCGGLRDYHNALWMSYAKHRTTNLRDLVKLGIFPANAVREMERAYDFILRVRNELHYIEGRESDILTLRLQGVVATNLEYPQKKILQRIEYFMREYYTHSGCLLHRGNELMDRFHLQALAEEKPSLVARLLRRTEKPVERFDGFISRDERIHPQEDDIFKEDPPRLMRLFVHTQQRHLRLSPELFQLVQKNWALINRVFRYNKAARESFEAILSQKGDVARVLRQMHRVGFLGRYLPEFGALTNLVQHEFFHRYPADEHTLRTIDKLDELAGTPKRGMEFFQQLFHEVQDPFILYLALILHDSGRAENTETHSDASALLADRVCRRLSIKGARRRLLMFLIDHHLTLYRTATTKNLDDPKVISEFAAIVRNKQQLDTLLVMTHADSRGTSDKSWNSWKESLLLHLYHSTIRYLNDPSDYVRSVSAPLKELQGEVHRKLDSSYDLEIAAHFEKMPRSYFNFRSADTIVQHIQVYRQFFEKLVKGKPGDSLLPELFWIDHPEQGCSELIVVSWDRHLLLARVAGALAAQGITILAADLYQRQDDTVLDIFRVCRTDFTPVSNDRTKARIKSSIEEAFETHTFDFSKAIAEVRKPFKGLEEMAAEVPQRVHFNHLISPDYTVIELQALDRIGLLYDVFRHIGQAGLNICHARINTEKGVALDSIYVQDKAGKKVADKVLLEALREKLEQAVFANGN